MNQTQNKKITKLSSAIVPLIVLVLGIGFIEYIIMQSLPWLQSLFPSVSEAILDSIVLSVSIAPIVYLIIRQRISILAADKSNIRNKLLISSGLPLIIAIALMIHIINQQQEQISTLQFTEVIVQFDEVLGKLLS